MTAAPATPVMLVGTLCQDKDPGGTSSMGLTPITSAAKLVLWGAVQHLNPPRASPSHGCGGGDTLQCTFCTGGHSCPHLHPPPWVSPQKARKKPCKVNFSFFLPWP